MSPVRLAWKRKYTIVSPSYSWVVAVFVRADVPSTLVLASGMSFMSRSSFTPAFRGRAEIMFSCLLFVTYCISIASAFLGCFFAMTTNSS
jgi:hypothetical protein